MDPLILVAGMCLIAGLWIGWLWGYCVKPVATAKPEALTATPLEITAVYEARREMEKMSNEELKAWEKEQAKKGKRRRA